MGYRIDYTSKRRKEPEERRSVTRIFLLSAAFLLIFSAAVGILWPEGQSVLWELVFPGGAEPARAAAAQLVADLQAGYSICDALDAFCAGIIDNGTLP